MGETGKLTKKQKSGIIGVIIIFVAVFIMLNVFSKLDFENVKASSALVTATITEVKKEYHSSTGRGNSGKTIYIAKADFTAPDGTVYEDYRIGGVAKRTKIGDTVDLYINNATGEFYIDDPRGEHWHTSYKIPVTW